MRAERSEAWQSRFKKINFKNLVSLINEFYQKWIASAEPRNDDYFTLRDDEEGKNYFEIISRFFMTFYIIVVDFTDYIITNYLLKNSSFNNFYLNYLNSFLNFGVMNNFVKLNDFVNGHLRKSFLLNTKNQKNFKKERENEKEFSNNNSFAFYGKRISVFGMYGPDSDWITFLTDRNRFRARADQLGFTLGNDMIKGTFGFFNNGT